ncbi:MAG: hemerythrin domain-containing protein [Woeseiaceae bacterium]|nr:hemerythrin domain-containing protein [Woeseiaceae bacterium]
MTELREDHRNMATVLNLLSKLVDEMEAGKDPDFELFDEIMRYMTVYPDAVHHPKEDVVYEQLREKRPDLSEGLDDVPEDHRDIARLGSLLRDEVEAVNAGAAVRREKMIEDTNAYIRRLRGHMLWEEDDLFPRIDRMLDAEPQKVDVSEWQHIKDPVFELEIEAGFRRLMQSLPPAA